MPVSREGIILYSQVVQLSPGSTTTCLNEGLGPYDPVAHNTSLGIYGWQHDKVWVNNGCSGEFEICYKGRVLAKI